MASRLPVWLHFLPACWLLFLLASPLYVMSSGSPQPAHALLALLAALVATNFFMPMPLHRTLYFFGFAFVGYAFLINGFWMVQREGQGDLWFMISSAFYLFNFAALLVIVTLVHNYGQPMIEATRNTLLLAVLLEALAVVVVPQSVSFSGIRAVGTFNNANQLGYWALLALSCYFVTQQSRLDLRDVLMIAAACFLAIISLSKGAMLATGLCVLLGTWLNGVARRIKLLVAALLLVLGVVALMEVSVLGEYLSGTGLERAWARLENIGGQADDSLAGRGYDRIWLYPEYLLFGSGEGGVPRFSESALANEMHSSPGTILFSYGILGALLFVGLIWVLIRQDLVKNALLLGPIMLYGLTHNGLRATLFWVFLGLCFAIGQETRRQREQSEQAEAALERPRPAAPPRPPEPALPDGRRRRYSTPQFH